MLPLAVEVLNPLAQFFFPSLDEAMEVFSGHYLVRTWERKAAGSRLQEGGLMPSESQEGGLAGENGPWLDGGPSLAGRALGAWLTLPGCCTGTAAPPADRVLGVPLPGLLQICSRQVI